jgi:hypothetical protein
VLIPAEDTVIARRAALFKTLIFEALVRREHPAIRAAGRSAAKPADRTVRGIPTGHLAIEIQEAQSMLGIMQPR